jgi:PBP1b-binding outer membrane lipoprotein LpoB
LKKKKMFEQETANLDNMIMRVAEQRNMLESQTTTVAVLGTMHDASKAAQANLKATNIQKVDQASFC